MRSPRVPRKLYLSSVGFSQPIMVGKHCSRALTSGVGQIKLSRGDDTQRKTFVHLPSGIVLIVQGLELVLQVVQFLLHGRDRRGRLVTIVNAEQDASERERQRHREKQVLEEARFRCSNHE